MKKISWPYVGSTEHEMGSMAPKGDPVRDIQMDSHHYDSLVSEKSVIPEMQDPPALIEEGMTSHMEVEDSNSRNLAEDKEDDDKKEVEGACIVLVLSEEIPLAEFECDIAEDISDKVAGLQAYKTLAKTAGLLFPYKKPQDVIYHMGTVSFPIDILFIGQDNKIKKIYKDIQPGTLATFGCASVSKVLEIRGGLSDRLGLSVGNVIKVDKNYTQDSLSKFCKQNDIQKSVITKYSKIAKTGFSNWKGYPIFTVNDNFLDKRAENSKLVTGLVKSFPYKRKRTIAVYLDGLINEQPKIGVFKRAKFDEDKICYSSLNNSAVCVGEKRMVSLGEELKDDELILSGFKSLGTFIPPSIEAHNIFLKLNKMASDKRFENEVVLVTKYNEITTIDELISARALVDIGPNSIYFNRVISSNSLDNKNLKESLMKVGPNTVLIGDDSLLSEAGIPVPEDIKEQAKRIYKLLSDAEELIEESKENISKNQSAYEKISDDLEKIPGTKGQYSQSVKRQTKIVKKYLIKIRDVVRGFNKIKDISTTMEIIDSLADASQSAADIVEEVFDLIDYIEDPSFFEMLTEKSEAYEQALEDLLATTDRAKEYINQHILGLTILSK